MKNQRYPLTLQTHTRDGTSSDAERAQSAANSSLLYTWFMHSSSRGMRWKVKWVGCCTNM